MSVLGPDGLTVIVGGSGFIGRYLVQDLAHTGTRLRVLVRNAVAAQFLKPLAALGQIEIVAGDVGDPKSLLAAFDGATAGVNLVGILDERVQKFDAVQARGAGNVAVAAAQAGVAAFVQMSAIGADANSPARYGQTKAAGEAAVRAALPHATILRPSIVFGPEDDFLNRFAAMARGPLPMMPVVAGNTKFQPVHVRDVARAAVAALGDSLAFGGKTFELGGPRIYTMRELIGWIVAEVRADKSLIEVPDSVARMLATLGSVLPGLPVTQDQLLMLARDNVATGDGLAAFGIAPAPMEAIAPLYLERFRTGGRFHRESAVPA